MNAPFETAVLLSRTPHLWSLDVDMIPVFFFFKLLIGMESVWRGMIAVAPSPPSPIHQEVPVHQGDTNTSGCAGAKTALQFVHVMLHGWGLGVFR